ncbi:hypothetical protein N9C62_02080 [Luminiphilus sp.]|nr:hypothetical protein [Luminiphilus sp.]
MKPTLEDLFFLNAHQRLMLHCGDACIDAIRRTVTPKASCLAAHGVACCGSLCGIWFGSLLLAAGLS